MSLFSFLIVFGVLLASFSQILLRKSALRCYKRFLDEYLNKSVIIAYTLMFISVFINLVALRNGVRVTEVPVIESLGYIFVPVLAFVYLKETLNRKQYLAIALIISGIYIFYY